MYFFAVSLNHSFLILLILELINYRKPKIAVPILINVEP